MSSHRATFRARASRSSALRWPFGDLRQEVLDLRPPDLARISASKPVHEGLDPVRVGVHRLGRGLAFVAHGRIGPARPRLGGPGNPRVRGDGRAGPALAEGHAPIARRSSLDEGPSSISSPAVRGQTAPRFRWRRMPDRPRVSQVHSGPSGQGHVAMSYLNAPRVVFRRDLHGRPWPTNNKPALGKSRTIGVKGTAAPRLDLETPLVSGISGSSADRDRGPRKPARRPGRGLPGGRAPGTSRAPSSIRRPSDPIIRRRRAGCGGGLDGGGAGLRETPKLRRPRPQKQRPGQPRSSGSICRSSSRRETSGRPSRPRGLGGRLATTAMRDYWERGYTPTSEPPVHARPSCSFPGTANLAVGPRRRLVGGRYPPPLADPGNRLRALSPAQLSVKTDGDGVPRPRRPEVWARG